MKLGIDSDGANDNFTENETSFIKECHTGSCDIGTYRSLFTFAKYAMMSPHVFSNDWDMDNFTGNLSNGFLKLPSYLNDTLIGMPLVTTEMLKVQDEMDRIFNLELFIPYCQFVEETNNLIPFWMNSYQTNFIANSYCTFFKPSNL